MLVVKQTSIITVEINVEVPQISENWSTVRLRHNTLENITKLCTSCYRYCFIYAKQRQRKRHSFQDLSNILWKSYKYISMTLKLAIFMKPFNTQKTLSHPASLCCCSYISLWMSIIPLDKPFLNLTQNEDAPKYKCLKCWGAIVLECSGNIRK